MLTLTLLLVVMCHVNSAPTAADVNTLKLVNIIFRHGTSTPERNNLYKTSPYYDESHWAPYGYGQLTNEGKLDSYNLGISLRERYNDFLKEEYNVDLVEGRTTDFNRTKASIQLVLAGLFPPTNHTKWSEQQLWLPIPYNYVERGLDKEMVPYNCPNWQKNFNDYLATQQGQAKLNQYKDTYDIINKNIGENITDITTFCSYAFGLELQEQFGHTLPDWTNQVYPYPLKNITLMYYDLMWSTKALKQMSGGYLLKKIMQDIEDKIKGTLIPDDRQMFLYSAHQNNIASVLNIFDAWDYDDMTPYNAYVALELHEIDGKFGLKVYYHDQTQDDPKLIKLSNCEEFCPIEKFKTQINDYISMNVTVCGEKSSPAGGDAGQISPRFGILLTLFIGLLIYSY